MQSKSLLIGLIIGALAVGAVCYTLIKKEPVATAVDETTITSFEKCAEVFPIQESYPARCVTAGGKSFTQEIGNGEQLKNKITLDTPRPNAKVSSPLVVSGMARGTWYFEASFPVELQDANGKVLFIGPAQAQGEWMTENFVPFKVTITFPKPTTSTGTLILRKDNPSGEASRDESLEIPVTF